jgi:hypothetical protein
MWYSLLADVVVALHIAYIAYVLGGLLVILAGLIRKWEWVRNPWFRVTHLTAILIIALELIFKASCPLTVWEMQLRAAAGQPVIEGTFIGRLMHYLIFAAVPGWVAEVVYIGFAVAIVITFVLAPPRFTAHRTTLHRRRA